jgi:hypothetical protein
MADEDEFGHGVIFEDTAPNDKQKQGLALYQSAQAAIQLIANLRSHSISKSPLTLLLRLAVLQHCLRLRA